MWPLSQTRSCVINRRSHRWIKVKRELHLFPKKKRQWQRVDISHLVQYHSVWNNHRLGRLVNMSQLCAVYWHHVSCFLCIRVLVPLNFFFVAAICNHRHEVRFVSFSFSQYHHVCCSCACNWTRNHIIIRSDSFEKLFLLLDNTKAQWDRQQTLLNTLKAIDLWLLLTQWDLSRVTIAV